MGNLDTLMFDLDGTLLPMDLDQFTQAYFYEMGEMFKDIIEPERLAKYIWRATGNMISNLEMRTNQEVFMENFALLVGHENIDTYKRRFDDFYNSGFLKTKKCVGNMPLIKKSIHILKDKGYELVIATNPIFPKDAIIHRIEWAGLKPDDFYYISCYEHNCFCKPQIEFYEEVLTSIGKEPHQCMMVGNDVQEDLVAGSIGMKTFLIIDCMIHRTHEPIECTHMGSYEDFYEFVKQLCCICKTT